jgi:hypothetical protein
MLGEEQHMTTQIVRGTNQQIADAVARMPERIVEAILLLDDSSGPLAGAVSDADFEKLTAEMEILTVSVGNVDYSRESIYSRLEGE